MKCPNCGSPITQTPGKRPKTYCNSTCRSNHWQKQNTVKAKRSPESYVVFDHEPYIPNGQNPAADEKTLIDPPGLKGIDLLMWRMEQKDRLIN